MTLRTIEGALVDVVTGLDDLRDQVQDAGTVATVTAAGQAAEEALRAVQGLIQALLGAA